MAAKKTKLELTWIGKDQRPKLEPRILLEDHDLSYHAEHRVSEDDRFDNILIHGDNLLALKALEAEYTGKVKCIFIDPPYNTGSAFTHYDDGVEHSIWLSLIRDRLEILRRLLSDDGSIWITIDDNEAHYLKVLCDEIFGRTCYVTTSIWEKADSPRNSARQFSADHDYVLIYSKTPEWVPNRLPRTEKANSIYENPDNDPRGPWLPGDPYANKPYSKGLYTVTGPTGRSFSPPAGRFWRVSEEKLKALDEDGRVWWGRRGVLVLVLSDICQKSLIWFPERYGKKMRLAAIGLQRTRCERCSPEMLLSIPRSRRSYWSESQLLQPNPAI